MRSENASRKANCAVVVERMPGEKWRVTITFQVCKGRENAYYVIEFNRAKQRPNISCLSFLQSSVPSSLLSFSSKASHVSVVEGAAEFSVGEVFVVVGGRIL